MKNRVKIHISTAIWFVSVLMLYGGIYGVYADTSSPDKEPTLSQIVDRVERRYEVPGFSASFFQLATIKAMDISDEATGRIFVKRPGKMRWEYEKPEKQIIITNGRKLWVYRPEDNQVMVGKSPTFFGDGKGAGFLADIKILRRKFEISLLNKKHERYHILKLTPLEPVANVATLHLYISRTTFDIKRVVTFNAYDDETRIDLLNSQFSIIPEDALFDFSIPPGVDVLSLDEE